MRLATALMGCLADDGPLRILPQIGERLRGGFYAGKIRVGEGTYALILSPKASGQSSELWRTTAASTANTAFTSDGASNTAAMLAAGADAHPAAKFCADLSIGGYTDWFLPAQDQLELCYRNFKPGADANDTSSGKNPASDPVGAAYSGVSPAQTSVTMFQFTFATQTGGAEMFARDALHWSSTSNGAGAYTQDFKNGAQTLTRKNTAQYVRAVRMVEFLG